jgi:hypothetical protein
LQIPQLVDIVRVGNQKTNGDALAAITACVVRSSATATVAAAAADGFELIFLLYCRMFCLRIFCTPAFAFFAVTPAPPLTAANRTFAATTGPPKFSRMSKRFTAWERC